MGIARVVESRSPELAVGSLVTAFPGWTGYSIDDAANASIIEPQSGLPETHFLGALGLLITCIDILAAFMTVSFIGCRDLS